MLLLSLFFSYMLNGEKDIIIVVQPPRVSQLVVIVEIRHQVLLQLFEENSYHVRERKISSDAVMYFSSHSF